MACEQSDNTLVWVNVMRFKQSERHQFLYSAPPNTFAMLESYANREGMPLRTEECTDLNSFSLMLRAKMTQDGYRVKCDFCGVGDAMCELSKQTVLCFRDSHIMRNDTDLLEFRQYGRPRLTFHDQIWSCCASEQCRIKAERVQLEEMSARAGTKQCRMATGVSTCAECMANPGKYKCARCGVAVYCSKECQHAAWPVHKNACKKRAIG